MRGTDGRSLDPIASLTLPHEGAALSRSLHLWRSLPRLSALLVLILSSAAPLSSQILPFKNFTTKDGLISNNIRALYQDSKGYLWIGTNDGLSVFDGYSFKPYTTEDGLPGNAIRCFYESRSPDGGMWIGTNNGVSRFCNGTFRSFRMGQGVLSNFVDAVLEDGEGVLWCGTGCGIYRIRDDRVETFVPDTSDFSSQSIVRLDDERIAFGCNVGLYLLDKRENLFKKIDCGYTPSIEAEMRVARENDSTLWVVANDSTLRKLVNLSVVRTWKLPYVLSSFLILGSEDNLWLGSSAGLFELQGRSRVSPSVALYTSENGLPGEALRAGLLDRENNLWVAVFARALSRLSDRYTYRFPFRSSQYVIMGENRLVVDRNAHFWVLEEPNVLREFWRSDAGAWKHAVSTVPLDHSGQSVKAGLLDASGRLWIMYADATLRCFQITGSDDAGSVLRTVKLFKPRVNFPTSVPQRFLLDRHNLLWYSFFDAGVVVFDLARDTLLRAYSARSSPPYRDVQYLHEDMDGNIWMGGDWGAGRLEGGFSGSQRITVFNNTNGLPGSKVNHITHDSHRRVWVATLMDGVTIIHDTVVRRLTTKDGLPSNWVASMKEGADGTMWIGTSAGLARVDVENNFRVESIDPLRGERIHSCKLGADGLVGIATDEALIVTDTKKSRKQLYPPSIQITELSADGKHVPHEGKPLEFSHTTTYFMIDYLGISLSYDEGPMYQYRLEGIDADWQKPTRERKIIYGALDPGEYTFRVQAITPSGVRSIQPASLHFIIHPPFWRQWWFATSILLLFVGATYGYVRRRVSNAQQEHLAQQDFSRQLINSQEQERKRIAGELHDSIAQNLLIIKNRAMLGLESCSHDAPAAKQLETISSVSSETIDNIREISYDLRPYQLDRLGLTKAIQSMISRMQGTFRMGITAEIADVDNCLPKDAEINFYRIVQEGLNNAIKHSHASRVSLSVARSETGISVRLEDDGKGFAVSAVTPRPGERQGFGLRGIAERMKIIGGAFSIQSSPGKGTILTISIPCKGEHHG